MPNAENGLPVRLPTKWTDKEIGELFAEFVKGKYVHCGRLGGWMKWDGRRWARDTIFDIEKDCKDYVGAIEREIDRKWSSVKQTEEYKEADVKRREKADEEYTDLIKQCRKYQGVGAIRNVIKVAMWMLSEPYEKFDKHLDFLNCRNGVVNLKTGRIYPHNPALYITKLADVEYNEKSSHFDLTRALQANSVEVRDWLHKFYGYCATGRVSEDVLPVYDGQGANGKTTVLLSVSQALGDYAKKVPPALLMKGAHDQHPAIFANLFGVRMAYIEETAEGGRLAVETMKDLTGGGEVSGRFMRSDWITFQSTHKLIVATNHRPIVNSTDYAAWRRLKLVPFPRRYLSKDDPDWRNGDLVKDPKLRDRLKYGEEQQKAVLAYIISGAVRWYKEGLGYAEEIRSTTREWRREEDVIFRFLNDSVDNDWISLEPTYKVYFKDLSWLYEYWCEDEGRPKRSKKSFSKALEEHDMARANQIKKGRDGKGIYFTGVEISQYMLNRRTYMVNATMN